MCALSKEQSILSRETIQNIFFLEFCPFFTLDIFGYFVISVIAEVIDFELGVYVYYPKCNPYYQGRQFKMHFFVCSELCSLFSSPEHNMLKASF